MKMKSVNAWYLKKNRGWKIYTGGTENMGIYLNPGNAAFSKAVHSKIYVDKTGLIAYTNECIGTKQGYLCVSRPRRFGKSMSVEMLAAYYSRGCDSEKLFSAYKAKTLATFSEHLNCHSVVFLNMQRFLSRAENAQKMVPYLEKCVLKELRELYPAAVTDENLHLSEAFEQIYDTAGESFVFLIDEWDCIFREERYDTKAQMRH